MLLRRSSSGVGRPALRVEDAVPAVGLSEDGVSELELLTAWRARLDEGDGPDGEMPLARLRPALRGWARALARDAWGVGCCCIALASFASFASLSKRPKSPGFVP